MNSGSNNNQIHFFQEGVECFGWNGEENKIKRLIEAICNEEKFVIKNTNFILVNDEALKEINLIYLNKDYYTDVIAFDLSEEENVLEGEIYISVDRIKENAKIYSEGFKDELRRVVAHGILHLVGYGDKEENEALKMKQKEDYYLGK